MLSPIKTLYTYFPLTFFLRILFLLLIFVAVGFIVYKQYKNKKIDKRTAVVTLSLVLYILIVLFFTVLGRRTKEGYNYNFDVIEIYKAVYLYPRAEYIFEIVLNILMFIPIGVLSYFAFKKHKVICAVLVGLCVSVTIEFSQLLLSNGFCAITDIIHNTLGTLLGGLIAFCAVCLYKELKVKSCR